MLVSEDDSAFHDSVELGDSGKNSIRNKIA